MIDLQEHAKNALKSRLKNSENYSLDEIAEIGSLQRKLFPERAIDKETTDLFRRLTALSNIRLTPVHQITSHRKIIGPLIVAVKKVSYPFISFHLKGIFEALEEFCAWSVYAQARNWRSGDIRPKNGVIKS